MKEITRFNYSVETNNSSVSGIMESYSLSHPENYGIYAPIGNGEKINIDVSDITSETWKDHYTSIINLMKDGIETEKVQNGIINVTFNDNVQLELMIPDYYLNLIMWYMLIQTNTPIMSYHLFFDDEIKQDTIKEYIDKFLINKNRKRFSNKELNNIIDDTLHTIHDLDQFAFFFANTVNLEDNIFMMRGSDEFNKCMHADLSNVPLEDVKNVGMDYANKVIEMIKNSKSILGYDHCLADACRASEGINPKQFKEFTINIGTKPDGQGSIFPGIINKSFINGGVSEPADYFIESSTGRTAQIIKYKNVGSSGQFARLLGLNNMDSFLNEDPSYDCGTQNFLEIVIDNKKTLTMLRDRYYRMSPKGIEKIIDPYKDKHLIGKKIYLRSPITCASAAQGHGYCYKCYGDLAYTVFDSEINFGVNVGRIASEIVSSALTQKLLSAKHLLETFIEKIVWVPKFNELFEIEGNIIRLNSDLNYRDFKLVIDPENIKMENEEDDDLSGMDSDDDNSSNVMYNEYVTEFEVYQNSTGEIHLINNDQNAKLYISIELNSVIRKKGVPLDGKIFIDFNELKDVSTVFIMSIQNNELSRILKHLEDLLNNSATVKGMDIHQLLQTVINTTIEGGLKVASTHLEVILSNQVRDKDDILKKAKWYFKNPDYEILSLDRALTRNPSVTVSLSYQKIKQLLYNPLTYKKNAASFMDLFFMEQPQYAINGLPVPEENSESKRIPGELYDPIIPLEDENAITKMAVKEPRRKKNPESDK